MKFLEKKIKKLRKERNWTQEYLAEQAGISVPFMTQIELASKQASLEVIEKIVKALNVPYEILFRQADGVNTVRTEFEYKFFFNICNNNI